MPDEPMIKYSIVVPFYNEEASIAVLYGKLVEVMDAVGDPYELVFVDDGSKDNSGQVLRRLYEKDNRVNVIFLRKNFGQTSALKAGFDFARGEIVISMDGDLQHDPEEIPLFIAKMAEGYDLVSGWRSKRQDRWITRQFPSRVANWLMAKLSRVPLRDFGTTFKAYRREILADIQLYGELHRFIPALASWAGASIAEIPIKNILRQSGKSNYGISRTVRVLLDLISVKFLLDYSTKPLQFFGLFGLLGTTLGSLIGIFLVAKKLITGVDIIQQHGPLLFMSMLLIISGIQFLAIGLLGEMLSRTYYESQKKPVYSVREIKSHRNS